MTFLSTLFGVPIQTSECIELLGKYEFGEAITNDNVQLVDVRTLGEYQRGHIKNAINIDLYQHTLFMDKIDRLDKEKPIYLYCLSGIRSQQAAVKLVEMGFTKIFDLQGGYRIWH